MKHELWSNEEGIDTFCLAGKHGDEARKLMEFGSILIWTCDAESHFEAMSKYHKFRDWGEYTTDFPEHDKKTYQELGWE